MKMRTKLLLSILAGLLAMLLSAAPMWWGVLFSPIARPLTTAALSQEPDGGFRWENGDLVLRFKSVDLLLSFLRR